MQNEQAPILVDEPLFFSEAHKLILILLISVCLLIGGWFCWTSYLSHQEEEVHRQSVLAKSPEEKRKVADQNKGTAQAAFIYLNLAHAALESKPQEALDLYEIVIAQYPHHLLVNAAQLGKGKALEQLQKPQEAMAVYQKIAQVKKGDAYVPLAILNLSRLQLAQGQWTEARQSLQDLLIGYSDYAIEAKERLKMIPEKKS